jgi:hypothetical protein
MSQTTTAHHLSAQTLLEQYGVLSYGPYPESDRLGMPGFTKSQYFKEISLTVPEGTELTKELVVKVVGAWVNLNLQNQEFIRSQKKYLTYANPMDTPLHTSLKNGEPNAERFVRTFQTYISHYESWKILEQQGYDITILQ